jgi:hypothetical protein
MQRQLVYEKITLISKYKIMKSLVTIVMFY